MRLHLHRVCVFALFAAVTDLAFVSMDEVAAQQELRPPDCVLGETVKAAGVVVGLPALPDREGFAGGYLGVSGDQLLFAGGANFPGKKPWEGGQKVWSEKVFALPLSVVEMLANGTGTADSTATDAHVWQQVGTLPAPLGYGASATVNDELILVGGSSASGHSSQVTAVRLVSGKLQQRSLPELPVTLANHCGTLVGSTVYIFGGQTTPTSLAEAAGWKLDPAEPNPHWSPLPKFPGAPRILAAAGAVGDQLLIVGGAELKYDAKQSLVRRYLSDVWKLDPQRGWEQLPALSQPSVAAPSPLPVLRPGIPILLGGDDGSQVGQNPTTHRGFPRITQQLMIAENRWLPGPNFLPAVVTAPVVQTKFGAVIASGEIRPGIRSPAVWLLRETTP
jgi:N-acetylneuraminic acid mutarotase